MQQKVITYETPELDTSYDFVSIIDGLSASERAGYHISQSIYSILNDSGVKTYLAEVNSRFDLHKELDDILIRVKSGKKCLIHIVAHGNDAGICCGHELVTWNEMMEYLQDIHEASESSLLLNMSTCKGLFGARTVPAQGRYPFFGIIGAKDDLLITDALKANQIMYRKWLNNTPVQKMVPETNSELGKEILFNLSAEGFRKLTN